MVTLHTTRTTVDMSTGEVVAEEQVPITVLPPAPGLCKVCASAHKPADPHNARSMYYQMVFEHLNGRAATWSDAAAHCDATVQDKWRRAFRTLGETFTEPPAGVAPIAHHGQGPDKP